jgi:hypothetical protein
MACIFIETVINPQQKIYQEILTIDSNSIQGPLAQFIQPIRTPTLSPFSSSTTNCTCTFAIRKNILNNPFASMHSAFDSPFLTPTDIPKLVLFLSSNNYLIDHQSTKIIKNSLAEFTNNASAKKIVCVFSYKTI